MKKTIVFFVVFGFVGWICLWQHSFFLKQYANFFTVNNAAKGADALVVLSGGMMNRLPYAIDLYQQEYAPIVLITEEKKRVVSPKLKQLVGTNVDQAKKILQALEVNVDLIVVPSLKGGATSTFDEAYDILQYARQQHWHRIIIVTDSFHTRRALYAFEKVLGKTELLIQSIGAPNPIFDESNWWQTDSGISTYVLEGIKYLVYRFTEQNVTFVKNY
ncbi:MAG: YdcF family protein [SAR324 cluster bacterium]|nr:YdcF family protein [SAR324 cluster bacterium]